MIGIQQVATELADDFTNLIGDFFRLAIVRAAALLRYVLTNKVGEGIQCAGNGHFTGPVVFDFGLNIANGLQGVAINDGRAHVADDVVGFWQRWVGQQRDNHFQTTAGHIGQLDVRVVADQLVKLVTGLLRACEQGSIKVCCK